MKYLRMSIALLLLASIVIDADPISNDNYTVRQFYEGGQPINSNDIFVEYIVCGSTQGGPYTVEIAVVTPGAPPAFEDLGPCVIGPGTYYYRYGVRSMLYGSEAQLSSTEKNFTVTAADPRFVPMSILLDP